MKKLLVAFLMCLLAFSMFFFAGCPKKANPAAEPGAITPVAPGSGDSGGGAPPAGGKTDSGATDESGG